MKAILFLCLVAALAMMTVRNGAWAGVHGKASVAAPMPVQVRPVPVQARPVPVQVRPVHVGHVGPYCLYYVGKYGRVSPYRYSYRSRMYPRYYGGTHARVMQNVGVSPADIGLRGSAW